MAPANSFTKTSKLALIAFTALISASATFLISSQFQKAEIIEPQIATSERLRYFNDNITLSGKNPQDEQFLLILDFYRKEVRPGEFLHYYFAKYWNGESKTQDYTSFKSTKSAVQENDFLKTYDLKGDTDLSTREYLNFTVNLDGQVISANSKGGLEGDFITKNNLNYTRYLSLDKIDVNVAGQGLFQTNLSLEKAYADDHSQFIYFPGYEDLKSRTYRFIVWDDLGNFYLIDDSKIDKPNKHYADHTWILHQNPQKQNEKSFYAAIDFREENYEKYWQIDLGTAILKLQTNYPTNENWVEGPINGTLEKNGQITDLLGTFSYKKE